MDAQGYYNQAVSLLPRGRAWTPSPSNLLGQLLQAFADGAAAFDAKLVSLAEEADPRTTTLLVGAWERQMGLPDSCTLALTDIADRRAAIWQKLTSTGGQSRAYFTEVAARLGYDITIITFQPTTCGARLGARCRGTSWRFIWQVVVSGAESAPVLECVLSKLKPADSAVFFTYEV